MCGFASSLPPGGRKGMRMRTCTHSAAAAHRGREVAAAARSASANPHKHPDLTPQHGHGESQGEEGGVERGARRDLGGDGGGRLFTEVTNLARERARTPRSVYALSFVIKCCLMNGL